jgi:threonine/homoserine/homoserine lactone efflux protein
VELTTLALFAGALILNAGSPGPSIAALVARVLTGGARSVMPFLAAMWIGEALWLTAAVAGLSYIAESFHLVFLTLKYCGVAYLFYLAWRMWTAPADVKERGMPLDTSGVKLFLSGMAITLGNPKLMMFYLAVLPAIIDLNRISIAGWTELTLTMLCVLIAVDLAWVTAAAQARRLLRSPRAVRIANRASAAAMGGAAVAIAAR